MKIRLAVLCFMLGLLFACDREKQPQDDDMEMLHGGEEVSSVANTSMNSPDVTDEANDSAEQAPAMSSEAEISNDEDQQSASIAHDDMLPLDLAKMSGCLACHSIEKKLVGPPWREVAARYEDEAGARDRLIAKVKKGGAGNWTEMTGGVPMPPYSPRVADRDISRLIDFILSLNQADR